MIYLSGLESVLTGSAQDILDTKETQHPQKVNRAVSFNAIKTQAFTLLIPEFGIRKVGGTLKKYERI